MSLRNVSKRFDTRLVIDGVSVTAGAGVVGLLGANGAGKTTLMRMIVGSISPDEGEVVVSGGDGRTAPRIGLLPQDFRVPRGISARAYLEYWAIENGLRRRRRRQEEVERVLDLVGLLEEAGRFIDAFSGGMRQRVGMARALLEDPDILVLDEPSAGMDLIAREGIRSVLAEYGKEHVVLFSTHIASDLEAVAERLLVLDGGKVRFDGSVSRFVESVAGRVWEQRVGAGELAAARRDHRVLSTRAEGDSRVVRALTAPGASLAGGRRCVPNLEDAYLAAIGGMRPALPRSEADLAFLAAVPPPIRRKAAPSP